MTTPLDEAIMLIKIIIFALVDDRKSVSVTGELIDDRSYRIDVVTAPSDIGKVIGKQGRNARSVRTILNGHAMRTKQRFSLNIIEGQRTHA